LAGECPPTAALGRLPCHHRPARLSLNTICRAATSAPHPHPHAHALRKSQPARHMHQAHAHAPGTGTCTCTRHMYQARQLPCTWTRVAGKSASQACQQLCMGSVGTFASSFLPLLLRERLKKGKGCFAFLCRKSHK